MGPQDLDFKLKMEEPPMKKCRPESVIEVIENLIKVISESSKSVKAVLSDELSDETIPVTKVYAGQIKEPKELSKAIFVLNNRLPLTTLQHLKRVKNRQILLFTSDKLQELTIQEFIDEFVPELSSSFEFFKEINVPSVAPKLRKQVLMANRLWSCNFHPNSYLERLAGDYFFDEEEMKKHRQCMRIALETAKMYLTHNLTTDNIQNLNACVVHDPSIKSVVAVSYDNREDHPIQHSAMIAIDNVAKTQQGGAWHTNDIKYSRLSGIDQELLTYLSEKFDNVNFGAKAYRPKSEIKDDDYGPYLCTGYDVYLIREPCLMCAMALVHARVKRVFFCIDNPDHGAVKSKTKLQIVPFLNHHFEVFTRFS